MTKSMTVTNFKATSKGISATVSTWMIKCSNCKKYFPVTIHMVNCVTKKEMRKCPHCNFREVRD